MAIRRINLNSSLWQPGENLSQEGGHYTHVTISYDISGERSKIDRHIHAVVEDTQGLEKVECVNTTIYWQTCLGEIGDFGDCLNEKVERKLICKLEEIFVNKSDFSYTTVTVFCMVGNIRAFAFEIDA
jgi:hypothetical protein